MTLRKREKKVSASPNPGRGGGTALPGTDRAYSTPLSARCAAPGGRVCGLFSYILNMKTNNKKKNKPKIQRSNRLGNKSRRLLYGTGNVPKGEKSVPKGGHCYVTFLL